MLQGDDCAFLPPLCLSAEESVDHLLLNCAMSQDIWNLLFYCFEYSWVLPSSIHGPFEVWKCEFGTPIGKLLWHASFFRDYLGHLERKEPEKFDANLCLL